jgi:DNA-directed RNA polymerase subunit beta'
MALENKVITLHSKIKCTLPVTDTAGKVKYEVMETTAGRMLIAQFCRRAKLIPFKLVNKLMTKKDVSNMIDAVYRHCGQKEAVLFADRIMGLGFKHAAKAGISFGKDDMIVPSTKDKHINETLKEVKQFEQQYADGLITSGEKYNKVIDAWSHCTERVAHDMMKQISAVGMEEGKKNAKKVNSIFMMANSGARGSRRR